MAVVESPIVTMRRSFILLSLLLASVAKASGDDFSNNLFSDLGPLLSLFGDRVTVQYLSQSMGILDDIIFAMAPLGIITAAVCAIRVGAPMWLKAVIGRSSEPLGEVERELLSSTSTDNCELWNGETIVRVPGSATILELVVFRDGLGGVVGVSRSSEVIAWVRKRKAFEEQYGSSGDDQVPLLMDAQNAMEMGDLPSGSANAAREEVPDAAPNISLNVRGDTAGKWEIWAVTFIGVAVQSGVLIYDGLISYRTTWSQHFLADLQRSKLYAFPLCFSGTLMVVWGMYLCGRIIEQATTEETVTLDEDSRPLCFADLHPDEADATICSYDAERCELLWLQKGEVVGDQLFGSFKLVPQKSTSFKLLTSRRRKNKNHHHRKNETWASVGATVSLVGFIVQFIGLRAMHWSASIAQLLATGIMVVLRIVIRRGQSAGPKVEAAPRGSELDWLAFNLGRCESFRLDRVHEKREERLAAGQSSEANEADEADESNAADETKEANEGYDGQLDLFKVRLDLELIAPSWHSSPSHGEEFLGFTSLLTSTLSKVFSGEFWDTTSRSEPISEVFTWYINMSSRPLEPDPFDVEDAGSIHGNGSHHSIPTRYSRGIAGVTFTRHKTILGTWSPFELAADEICKLRVVFSLWKFGKEPYGKRTFRTGLDEGKSNVLLDLWIRSTENIGELTIGDTNHADAIGFDCIDGDRNIAFVRESSIFNHCALHLYSSLLFQTAKIARLRLDRSAISLILNPKRNVDKTCPFLLTCRAFDEIAELMESHRLSETDALHATIISAFYATGDIPGLTGNPEDIMELAAAFIRLATSLTEDGPLAKDNTPKAKLAMKYLSFLVRRSRFEGQKIGRRGSNLGHDLNNRGLWRRLVLFVEKEASQTLLARRWASEVGLQIQASAAKMALEVEAEVEKGSSDDKYYTLGDATVVREILSCYDHPCLDPKYQPGEYSEDDQFDNSDFMPPPDAVGFVVQLEDRYKVQQLARIATNEKSKNRKKSKIGRKRGGIRREPGEFAQLRHEHLERELEYCQRFQKGLKNGLPFGALFLQILRDLRDDGETRFPVIPVLFLGRVLAEYLKFATPAMDRAETFEVLQLAVDTYSPTALDVLLSYLNFDGLDQQESDWQTLFILAWSNYKVAALQTLLLNCPFNINRIFNDLKTKLGGAIMADARNGAQLHDETPSMERSILYDQMIEMLFTLLSAGITPSNLPLHELLARAMEFYKVDTFPKDKEFKFLIWIGADINGTIVSNETVFSWACRLGDIHIVEALIGLSASANHAPQTNVADIDTSDAVQRPKTSHIATKGADPLKSPLLAALSGGHSNIVEYLLDERISRADEDIFGRSPEPGKKDIDVDWRNFGDSTAYAVAVDGRLGMADMLLKRGASPGRFFYLSVKYERLELSKWLLETCGQQVTDGQLDVTGASGHTGLAILMLEEYVHRKSQMPRGIVRDQRGDPPDPYRLTISSDQRDLERRDLIKALIARGPNLNAVVDGFPVLILAASSNDVEMVTLLLEGGADINILANRIGFTFLHFTNIHDLSIQKFYRQGIHVSEIPEENDLYSDDGHPWQGHQNTASYGLALRTSGFHMGCLEGQTALAEAIYNHHTDLALYLINRGANVNQGSNQTRAVLHYCVLTAVEADCDAEAVSKVLDLTSRLIEKGADVRRRDWLRRTALDYAMALPALGVIGSRAWQSELVRMLKEAQNSRIQDVLPYGPSQRRPTGRVRRRSTTAGENV